MSDDKNPVILASAMLEHFSKEAARIAAIKAQAELAAATPQLPEAYLFKPPQQVSKADVKLNDKSAPKRKRGKHDTDEDEDEDDEDTQAGRVAKLLAPDDIDLPNGKQGRLVPLRSYAKFADAKELDAKGRVTSKAWRRCTLQCKIDNIWKPLTAEYFYRSTQNYTQLDQRCKICKSACEKAIKIKAKSDGKAKTKVKAKVNAKPVEDPPSPSLVDGADEGKGVNAEDIVKLPNGGTGQLLDTGRAKCEDCKEFGTGMIWRKCMYDFCRAIGDRAWKPLNKDNFSPKRIGFDTTCRRCIRKFKRGDIEPDPVSDNDSEVDKKQSAPSFGDSAVVHIDILPTSASAPAAAVAAVAVAPRVEASVQRSALSVPFPENVSVPTRQMSLDAKTLLAALEAKEAQVQARIKQLKADNDVEMKAVEAAANRLEQSFKDLKDIEAKKSKFAFSPDLLKSLGIPVPMDTSSS